MSLTKENSNYASGDTKERANSDLSESDRSTPPRDPNSTFQAYRLTIDEVAQEFNTSIVDGLGAHDAENRIQAYGPNNLGEGDKISYPKILAHQVFNAMILVLIISMIIALAIKDWISGGVIAFVVFLTYQLGSFKKSRLKNYGIFEEFEFPNSQSHQKW